MALVNEHFLNAMHFLSLTEHTNANACNKQKTQPIIIRNNKGNYV